MSEEDQECYEEWGLTFAEEVCLGSSSDFVFVSAAAAAAAAAAAVMSW